MNVSWPLSDLLAGFAEFPATCDRLVTGLSNDSRQVRPGDLFLATRGFHHHGLEFLPAVRAARAAAIAWEPPFAGELPQAADLPLIRVDNLSRRIGPLARRFYNDPGRDLRIIGITGTDGKTSCAHLIAHVLQDEQAPCGILGTLGQGVLGVAQPAAHTTPDALTVQRWLADLRGQGVRFATMEVSSHALDQERVAGVDFAIAVLTNLGRDHLDYHRDVASYAAAKARLFIDHQPSQAVLNFNDPFGRQLMATLSDRSVISYGIGAPPPLTGGEPVWGEAPTFSARGVNVSFHSSWGEGLLASRLLGHFNASNLLAALSTVLALGMPLADAVQRLSRAAPIMGRMERFGGEHGLPLVVVDYAHTPQALEQALRALRNHCAGRLWCVFGCGGDRDAGKRPLMGAIAERDSDQVIVTDDNPRSEDPALIVQAILSGMRKPAQVQVIEDRRQAIQQAIAEAATTDVVLVAGKGHEDYQLVGNRRIAFSDREIVRDCLAARDPIGEQRRAS
ncbi:MAG: UDP-N-acetylmuramoyl-L-alanyl-D-glutamate--2,6-diaminopimelate ligase [Gammaproteobacteria bacterium]|nr:UDP-N-acetylmuramoyl-L-alanyl-D-glutamate--2,6-diaminopimelate ligase [Gammaproteobacteria bacterium]MCP5423750.1 UDP-N-acetylmuramoyl-L-alanyl-D-glutamate--2,6-diaminopimelate ligase [Gammaproteobacteria bacterium]MCP5459668.1 UDP-N-acetylmuramoyl-L-alanyl-D-glutamate--2,6-diaminopimelate ligase [Gammaproteobacteria bacterium]